MNTTSKSKIIFGGGGESTSPSQRKDTHYPQKSFLARTKNYNAEVVMNNQHKNNQINHTGFTAYNKVKYGLKSFFLTRRSSSFTAYVKGKEYDASTSSQIRSSSFTACVKQRQRV